MNTDGKLKFFLIAMGKLKFGAVYFNLNGFYLPADFADERR
jgi:hypothetical protein